MEVKSASVSVGCNKSANCLDWGCGSLLAYGAHNQVVLYDDEVRARGPGWAPHRLQRTLLQRAQR